MNFLKKGLCLFLSWAVVTITFCANLEARDSMGVPVAKISRSQAAERVESTQSAGRLEPNNADQAREDRAEGLLAKITFRIRSLAGELWLSANENPEISLFGVGLSSLVLAGLLSIVAQRNDGEEEIGMPPDFPEVPPR